MTATRIMDLSRCTRKVAALAAVEALEAGELVILPTDTVYGLAARADDEAAVKRVFEAKQRPADRPLPILIPDAEQLERVALAPVPAAKALANAFWPGPLTIVVPRSPVVPGWVTAGATTVGVRVPDDATALLILRMAPFLVAATSANLSDEPTPATARECAQALSKPVAVVIEDGPRPNSPSTVVAVEGAGIIVLRQGPISEEALRAAIG
jgi:L-threonylcarbamoyladenylate synthase